RSNPPSDARPLEGSGAPPGQRSRQQDRDAGVHEQPSGHSAAASDGRTTASGPPSSSRSNASSSRIRTPRLSALSYFDPGESPTTTYEVFLLTEPPTLPPRDWTASVAESRLCRSM